MRRLMMLSLLFGLTAGACSRSSTEDAPPADPAKPDSQARQDAKPAEGLESGDFVICRPIRSRNLTIFPVASKVPKNEDRFITLEEGLRAGTVEIFEVGATEAIDAAVNQPPEAGDNEQAPSQPEDVQQEVEEDVTGDVNRLMVLNRAEKPLYLMPGEVIYGGKQDRTIAEETIILADGKPMAIEVYCVEQGRWAGRSEGEVVALVTSVMAFNDRRTSDAQPEIDEETLNRLAAEAKRGKFVGSAGALSKASRMTVQARKGQQAVWDQVSLANAAADVQVDSGAFTVNYSDPEVLERLEGYIDELQAPVAGQKQVVGAIVAVNGKIEAVDVFESTPLFKKLWPRLLKSHALDAANVVDEQEAKKVCKLGEAKEFLDSAMQANVEEKTTSEGGLVVTRRESSGVVSFSAAAEDAKTEDAAMGMGMGGFSRSVHSSAFSQGSR